MENIERIRELRQQGFYCSQIILIMGMELQGKSNPDLVRSMHALAGGIGFSGELCGALSGAACLLGYYAGKGLPEQTEDLRLEFMLRELVKWFKAEYEPLYGSIRCESILAGDRKNSPARCPLMVDASFQKAKELLVENGYDLSGLDA